MPRTAFDATLSRGRRPETEKVWTLERSGMCSNRKYVVGRCRTLDVDQVTSGYQKSKGKRKRELVMQSG